MALYKDYIISVAFSDGVAPYKLTQEIRGSAITIASDGVTVEGDNCRCLFKAELESADETLLDALVAAHDGIELDLDSDLNFEKRLVKTVGSYDTEILNFVPSNGSVITIKEMGGTTPPNINDCKAEITWDGDLIFVTHGPSVQDSITTITGDGVKVLQLKLTNDSGQTETCSVYCLGKEI